MLKKYSHKRIFEHLCELVESKGIIKTHGRGRPCKIPKHQLICYILFQKCYDNVLEEMELDSELYLGTHYDHGTFSYHYKKLDPSVIEEIVWHYERLIVQYLEHDIAFHIFDSTAISTSVNEERLNQGTRRKEKLTQKVHTCLGYDPPKQLVVVESCKATTSQVSDSKGAILMLRDDMSGYALGDAAYETYELIESTEKYGLCPIYRAQNRPVKRKFSAKKRARDNWDKNAKRIYQEIRGVGEVLYGAATRAGLLKSECRLVENQHRDSLVISLRQNMLTFLRLEA